MADRQRRIFVRTVGQCFVDEQVARRAADHLQHAGIGQPFLVKPLDQAFAGALRGHADPLALQMILTAHHSRPSSQPSSPAKASWKVRSSCNGVMET